jgi:hypothetical protein
MIKKIQDENLKAVKGGSVQAICACMLIPPGNKNKNRQHL